MSKLLLAICSVFFYLLLHAQTLSFDKNYFQWPVKLKPAIVANFGELRPSHWHMGLDIRTNQKENLPVFAAAGGYISRITVQPFGFGKAIYINHPNGLTTVYGHLNKFFSALDSFVTDQQRRNERWEISIRFDKKKFPVHKGQFIGYSGNTGSSQGPHVHFEIRNTATDRCINPQFFDLGLNDNVSPEFIRLALYNRNQSTYAQQPLLFAISKTKNGYQLKSDSIIKTGFSKLSFAITAIDKISGSNNPNGIYSARLYVNNQLQSGFVLDSMDYNETNYMNAHIDYPFKINSGLYLQHLSPLPGDLGPAYKTGNGIVELNDTLVKEIKIEISDVNRNISCLVFNVQYDDSLAAAITNKNREMLAPGRQNEFIRPDFKISFGRNSFYDSVPVTFLKLKKPANNAITDAYQFCNDSYPVHESFELQLKMPAVPEHLRNKIVISHSGQEFYRKKALVNEGWMLAEFNEFGSFQAFIDTTPPVINDPGKGDTIDLSLANAILFYPKDESGIGTFRAELNGTWLMFDNDKGNAWRYNFEKSFPYGVHHLKIWVTDIAGNQLVKQWWFKRNPYIPPKKKAAGKKKTAKHKLKSPGKKEK
ncbi:MAG: M23 family peptidase [Chitinophagaceae bacterium]